MGTLLNDLRWALRMLVKSPALTAVVVLTLGLGIGATTTIFGIVDVVLFRPLPHVPDPDGIVWFFEHSGAEDTDRDGISAANFADWRSRSTSFSQLSALRHAGLNLSAGSEPERVRGFAVSASFFDLLGSKPALGRTFAPGEDASGKDHVVVLSHGFWQRRLGADPSIVGKPLQVDGEQFTVIGVMPAFFAFPKGGDLWLPLTITPEMLADRAVRPFAVIGRLAPGVPITQAQAELDGISASLAELYPETNRGWGVSLITVIDLFVGPRAVPALALLLAVCFVLLIACANVASLLLARATTRERELAIRAALGAGRGRLVRQLLTESVVLALAAGAFGVLVALWGVDLFVAMVPDVAASQMPRLRDAAVDGRCLAFTLGLSLLTALVFGAVPALKASRPDLARAFQETGAGASSGTSGRRLRDALVVAQVTLAVLLLIGAGWSIQSYLEAQHRELGFQQDGRLAITLTESSVVRPGGAVAFQREVLRQVAAVPGVQSAALASNQLLDRGFAEAIFTIEGRPPPEPAATPWAKRISVTPGYFDVVGIKLLSGRLLTEDDNGDGPGATVIGERLARAQFPEGNAVGQRLVVGKERLEVVGVVSDVHDVGNTNPGFLYTGWEQGGAPEGDVAIVLNTRGDALALREPVRSAIRALDAGLPVPMPRLLAEVVDDSFAPRRVLRDLLLLLSAIALVLASVGIYGVIAYTVSRRTAEIGIRSALGAKGADILRLVMARGLVLTGIGLGLGVALGAVLTRVIAAAVHLSTTAGPLVFATVVLLLGVVALGAGYAPARRAIRLSPMLALRRE